MPSPDFGFGITNLVAEVRPAQGGGVFVTATGDSPEGDLDARVILLFGEGRPLTLDIQRAAFAGMVARGRVAGAQFHPERSSATGARLLANFLQWNPT